KGRASLGRKAGGADGVRGGRADRRRGREAGGRPPRLDGVQTGDDRGVQPSGTRDRGRQDGEVIQMAKARRTARAKTMGMARENGGHSITLTVNGQSYTRVTEPRVLLVDFLRDDLRLTGTHVGCDTSHCGACTVLLDGRAVKSCTVLAVQAEGRAVT